MNASNLVHGGASPHLLLSRVIENLKLQGISEAYLSTIVFPESLISCDYNPLEQTTRMLTPEDPLFRPLHNLIQTIETSLLPIVSDPNPVHDVIDIYRRFILEQCFEITGVDYQDELGQSLLHFATKEGDEQKVKKLLKKGANPCVINKNRETLLHIAAAHGHLSILQTLLRCEDLNQMIDRFDGSGQTALYRAVQANLDEIVEVLMKEEADIEICDLNGKTPLQVAQEMGNKRVIELLQETDLVPSLTGDVEGQYYLEFESAYDEFDIAKQIFYLEKMAVYALEKENFLNAAHLLNGAITLLLKRKSSPFHLVRKLIKIEKMYLRKLFGLETGLPNVSSLIRQRESLYKLRLEVFDKIQRKVAAEEIQSLISQWYKQLLSEIVDETFALIQQRPPANYAIIGLGSVAREEACPYSDVEFAIIVENDSPEALEFFRNLSRLIELKIINLGETERKIVRFKKRDRNIRPESSLTPSGFSMDSGLSPLGKTGVYELIATPEKLASYQNPTWFENNDAEVILVNALTCVSYVSGEYRLLNDYNRHMRSWLDAESKTPASQSKPIRERQKRALKILQGHVEEFQPFLSEERLTERGFDAKRDFYRPIQMAIHGLALYHGLDNQNTLASIEDLKNKGVINKSAAENLSKALRLSLQLRIEAHLFYNKEKEIICCLQEGKEENSEIYFCQPSSRFLNIYSVLVPLHQAMIEFVKNPKFSLKTFTFLDNELIKKETSSRTYWGSFSKVFTPHHLSSTTYAKHAVLNPDDPNELNQLSVIKEAQGELKKALTYAQQTLKLAEKTERFNKEEGRIDFHATLNDMENPLAYLYRRIGDIHYKLGNKEEALRHYQLAFDNLIVSGCALFFPLEIRGCIVKTCLELGNYKLAIAHASEAIKEATSNEYDVKIWSSDMNFQLAQFYYWLGIAYQNSGDSRLGRQHLIMYISILQLMSEVHKGSFNSQIAEGYLAMGNFDKAIELLERGVDDGRKNRTSEQHSRFDLYTIKSLQMLATAYQKQKKFLQAIKLYHEIFDLMCDVSDEPHSELAHIGASLGRCYLDIDNIEKALGVIRVTLQILDQILSVDAKLNQVAVLLELRDYYASKQDSKNKILYFNQARTVFESLSEEESKHHTVYQKLKETFYTSPSLSPSTHTSESSERAEMVAFDEELNIVKVLLEQFGFDHPITCDTQVVKYMLREMLKVSHEKLAFSGCYDLTDQELFPFLEANRFTLTSLDLSGCMNITGKSIIHIAQYCTELKELNLSDCHKLDLIENWGVVYSTALNFPNLVSLNIQNCPILKRIRINAPRLKELKADPDHVHKLRQIELHAPDLREFSIKDNELFGMWKWTYYFGNIGSCPPLPPNLEEILHSPCPFFSDCTVDRTHRLLLMPKSINNQRYSLKILTALLKNPKHGNKLAMDYSEKYLKRHLSTNQGSYWLLVTNFIIPESLCRIKDHQENLLKHYSAKSGKFVYRLPTMLEAATYAGMKFVAHNERILIREVDGKEQRCLTFCKEDYNSEDSILYSFGLSFLANKKLFIGFSSLRRDTANSDHGVMAVHQF